MSADLLRRAAKTLREHAEKATPGPWVVDDFVVDGPEDSHGLVADTMNDRRPDNYQDEANAELIALMHPPVALALADWLDQAARHVDARIEAEQHVGIPADTIKQDDERRAEDVARAILREGDGDA